jgi:YD repeat-containing protein
VVVTVGGNPSNNSSFVVGTTASRTYHLDQAAGLQSTNLLTTASPTTGSTFLQTSDLKGLSAPGAAQVGAFSTLTGIPGSVLAGSIVNFTVWMNETAAVSGIFPNFILQTGILEYDAASEFCRVFGTNQLTTTLTKYQLSCTVPSSFSIASSASLWLYVEATWNNSPNKSVKGQVYFDGIPNGNYDSWVTFPEVLSPAISSISPTTGSPGTTVTINGSSFGATQGTSAVSLGGVAATVSSWSDTQIIATAPCGAGPVVVTVAGSLSNAVTFSVSSPVITSVSPNTASVGTSVTINGSNFVESGCSTTASFNGISSTPTSVTANQVITPVPAGATPGPLAVMVGGIPSSSVQFTPLGTITGTVTSASNGNPISGASALVLQANTVVASTTTDASGNYSAPNLNAGRYDVLINATGYGAAILPSNSVLYGTSTTVNASLTLPGTLSGRVTQVDGITAIPGASVTAAGGSSAAGSAITDGNGNYSISTLGTGLYSVLAAATGFLTQSSGNVSVTSGNNTTQNFNLPAGAGSQSVISYFYDELGRLIGVSDSLGNTASYSYDAAGNLLSITVNPSSQASIIGFDPIHGPIGTTVTISGTGFSSTANQNTVTFNGTAATVLSASSTQLVVTVPAGATTGIIQVTSPSGTANSNSSFVIP